MELIKKEVEFYKNESEYHKGLLDEWGIDFIDN